MELSEKATDKLQSMNPFRIAFVIALGVLAIYTGLLWRKLDALEREVFRVNAIQLETKVKLDAISRDVKLIRRRLPVGDFMLPEPVNPGKR